MLKKTLFITLLSTSFAFATDTNPSKSVELFNTQTQQSIGTIDIDIDNTKYGVIFEPHLHDVPAGYHGFHLHINPDCGNGGMNAGGHFDPENTNSHKGPYADGHLGDLPVLFADDNGYVTQPILAPRIKITDLDNHSLMIHAGGDNYSDTPEKLGGGGARFACGVVE